MCSSPLCRFAGRVDLPCIADDDDVLVVQQIGWPGVVETAGDHDPAIDHRQLEMQLSGFAGYSTSASAIQADFSIHICKHPSSCPALVSVSEIEHPTNLDARASERNQGGVDSGGLAEGKSGSV